MLTLPGGRSVGYFERPSFRCCLFCSRAPPSRRGAVVALVMTREGDTILQETTQLRRRHDDLTAECAAVRQKLALLVERRDGFVPTSHLDANKDEDAAEVAGLEDELAEVEHATDVANHERKTYELMIERIRSEEKTYRKDLETIDVHQTAKQADADQLHLMLKDATDVRDGARAELAREDEALSEELGALSDRLKERHARLAAKRAMSAEHEEKTSNSCRRLEREKAQAVSRREQVVAVGSLENEREEIGRLQVRPAHLHALTQPPSYDPLRGR